MRMFERGMGICANIYASTGIISGKFAERLYVKDFLKLSNISLPCSTPATIEVKSSERTTMSAAFFATSDPEPIATPISAFFMAGESFTPSPVTATTWPAL